MNFSFMLDLVKTHEAKCMKSLYINLRNRLGGGGTFCLMNVHVMGVYVLSLRHRPLATTIHVRCLFMFIHVLYLGLRLT